MLPPVRASPVSSTNEGPEDHVLTIPSGGEEDTVAYMLQCLQCWGSWWPHPRTQALGVSILHMEEPYCHIPGC